MYLHNEQWGNHHSLVHCVKKKPMNRVSHTSHRACQVQGKHEGRSDRSRVRRKETQVSERLSLPLTYWLRVLGQALHSESQQMRVRSHR